MHQGGLYCPQPPCFWLCRQRTAQCQARLLIASNDFGFDVFLRALGLGFLLHRSIAPNGGEVCAHAVQQRREGLGIQGIHRAEDLFDRFDSIHLGTTVRGFEGIGQQRTRHGQSRSAQACDELAQTLQVALLLGARQRNPVRAFVKAKAVDEHLVATAVGVGVVVAGPHAQKLVGEILSLSRLRGRQRFDEGEGI